MNIGVDVDGVLIDMEGYQLKYGKKYFNKLQKKIVNPSAYDIEQIFDCTYAEREKFWKKYIWAYCLTEPAIVNAAEILLKLHNDGHKVVIITGRSHTTESGVMGNLFRLMMKYWLRRNHIIYDDIVFCSEKDSSTDKLEACINYKIDFMIDDKPENLLALKNKIKVICYSAVWNMKLDDKHFVRADNWDDIYEILKYNNHF